ncbi:hypothetical protein [Nocardia wallacei]|uniref:hypothetical protein n=1 Tax=Nocardia wallacei TaxID=480035 RepID=UPI002458EE0A|nr:hypothetical protein [Nocardia wallacei]
MTAPDQPRIVDQAAHDERVALDQQIRTLTDKLQATPSSSDRIKYREDLHELRDLQERRKAAFRREVGWPA